MQTPANMISHPLKVASRAQLALQKIVKLTLFRPIEECGPFIRGIREKWAVSESGIPDDNQVVL